MSLKTTFRALEAEVHAPRNGKFFDEATCHQRQLEGYRDFASVLAVLRSEAPKRYEEKEHLVRALLAEAQRRPHPYWNAALIVVFYPMLTSLSRAANGSSVPAEDRDQLIMTVFLGVARRYRLDQLCDRTCMRLRQMTRKEVIRRLRDEQRTWDRQCVESPWEIKRLRADLNIEGLDTGWPQSEDDQQTNLEEDAELIRFLLNHAGKFLDGNKLELVVATLIRREGLSRYVDRIHPELTKSERSRVYQRIKRRHSRAIAQLREVFADFYRESFLPDGALPCWAPTETSDWCASAA
jgi:hypothetical protein